MACYFDDVTTQIRNFSMTANLVLRMKTTGDKSESECGIAWKKFESGNVLTESFWRSGNE